MKLLALLKSKLSANVGAPPGTLTYVGKPETLPPKISRFSYSADDIVEVADASLVGDTWQSPEGQVAWINSDGVHDLTFIEQLGAYFGLHPLILEDIVNTTQRPRLEQYENGLYLVLKMISYQEQSHEIDVEQVSLFLGEGYVLTFQEKTEDVFDPIRTRLLENLGRIRKRNADYLFYALVDIIISNYFLVLEGLGDQIAQLEERLHESDASDIIEEIQGIKRSLIFFRKSVLPLRDVMVKLVRTEDLPMFEERTATYLRDLQTDLIQVLDMTDTYRDILSNLYDLHFALNGQRMNEIMKVLTIVTVIFVPLTFIAGIYGMNFQHMPELGWRNGYFAVWGLIIVVALLLILYFRRKSWL